ncbi:hypothetical protein NE237_002131 [Protea cynaroides]|uniref:Uncharacterized protein n=1 Tax=Protea cynaroides TaxID=273540 RepID=A0A9Q0QZ53_9MAGN|nr:hypothetical protein NE237_002131 [Protea cynaroides]
MKEEKTTTLLGLPLQKKAFNDCTLPEHTTVAIEINLPVVSKERPSLHCEEWRKETIISFPVKKVETKIAAKLLFPGNQGNANPIPVDPADPLVYIFSSKLMFLLSF